MTIRKTAKSQPSRAKSAIGALTAISLVTLSMGLALSSSAAQPRVELGAANSFAVLAGSTITVTGSATISGTSGLSLGSSPTGSFTGSKLVVINGPGSGTIHTAADPITAAAKTDLTAAYLDAAGRTPATTVTPLDLGGRTLKQGVYTSGSSLALTGTLTLDGENNPNAVFVFKSVTTLKTASASKVVLINGAQACNVFWKVGSSATFGTTSNFVGQVLADQSITATTGAKFKGSLLARIGAVTLDTNTIVHNLCVEVATPTPTTKEVNPESYQVVVGDSLDAVAEKFNLTLDSLLEYNGLSKDSIIYVGQILRLQPQALTTDVGGQLPDTDASNWVAPFAAGLGMIALGIGVLVARRRRS